MKKIVIVAGLLLSLPLAACKKETRDEVKDHAESAASAVKKDMHDTAHQTKEAFITATLKQLDDLDAQIDKLAAKAKAGTEKAKAAVENCRQLSKQLRDKIAKLKDLPGEAWRAAAKDIGQDLQKLGQAVIEAGKEVGG
jgi:peptidoglycan hydrolase CwlO-like protein